MRKKLLLSLILIYVLALVGCENGGSDMTKIDVIENNDANTIYIYYPGEKQIEKAEDKYQLKQPDSVAASVEEVMSAISDKLGEAVIYQTYMLDVDNNVTLEFFVVKELSKEKMLLTKAAITETLFQIKGINNIKIKFINQEGDTIDEGLYLPGSFYFYK